MNIIMILYSPRSLRIDQGSCGSAQHSGTSMSNYDRYISLFNDIFVIQIDKEFSNYLFKYDFVHFDYLHINISVTM